MLPVKCVSKFISKLQFLLLLTEINILKVNSKNCLKKYLIARKRLTDHSHDFFVDLDQIF